MFCPKCATQNLDGASFCRSCGANISLVPQALTGQLGAPQESDREDCLTENKKDRLSLELAFKNIFSGVAFLLVSFALARSIGRGWWFWMLLPAFSLMGKGIAQYLRLRERERKAALGIPTRQTFAIPTIAPPVNPVLRRNTGELMPPVASVTEGTTRHLGVEAKTRQLDSSDQK